MVKHQNHQDQLFYTYQELSRSSRQNFYIQLKGAGLDWEKLSKPFEAAFSQRVGRPTDPVVYLKAFLVAYFENITYDTDLAERIDDSKAIREFLGYNLCEQTPDHSSISRNRGKIAERCQIEDVLSEVVKECIRVGLVDGELSAVDASLVPANASLSSLVSAKTGKSVREHLKEVAEKNKLAGESGEKREKPKVSNEEFVSKTDPDARIAQKRNTPRDMCYMVTHVTDSKSGIILGADCAHADDGEANAARPVLEEARDNLAQCEMKLKQVVADSGYDSSEFIVSVEDMGAEPVINYQQDSKKKPDGFRKESFTYDKDRDCYICPRGCILRYSYYEPAKNRRKYVSSAEDCAVCQDRDKCLGGGSKRCISRIDGEESREQNISRCHTDEGRAVLKARKHIVEPPFGHMKTYGGMRLINCRGKAKARVKTVMGAVAYNLIKLVRFLAKKKREAALAAMLQIAEVQTTAQVAKMTAIPADVKRFLMICWRQWMVCAQLLFMLVKRNRYCRCHAQVT